MKNKWNVYLMKAAVTAATLGMLFMNSGCSKGAGTSAASLNERFSTEGSAQFVDDPNNTTFEVDPNAVSGQASALSISLALSILRPATTSTDGVQLYAADLKAYGGKVITGYNVPGSTDKGWLDFVDVTTIAAPLLLGSQYLTDTDVNGLAMNNGNFALVGAQQGIGSKLMTGTFNLLGFSLNSTQTDIPSYAGAGVTFDSSGTHLATTSGDAGGLSIFNSSSLTSPITTTASDARNVAYSSVTGKYYVVSGQPGAITSYDTSGNVVATRALGGATIPNSKSTVVAGTGQFLLATTGDGGFSVVCASHMKIAASQTAYQYANYASLGLPDPTQTVTNAAVFGPGMIFTAAGAGGFKAVTVTATANALNDILEF